MGVPLVRERMEATPADSIGSFRRQLTVLERAGPTVLAPANRLRGPALPSSVPGGVLLPPIQPGAAPRVLSVSARSAALRRRQAQHRRRTILFVLLAIMSATLAGGFLSGLRVLWGVHVVMDMIFIAYVTLLVRLRNLAAEREMKLRFLPSPTTEPALLLRRSVN